MATTPRRITEPNTIQPILVNCQERTGLARVAQADRASTSAGIPASVKITLRLAIVATTVNAIVEAPTRVDGVGVDEAQSRGDTLREEAPLDGSADEGPVGWSF